MSWSEKYKRSIDCDNPKGFSQRAHCQGRKKSLKEQLKSFKTVQQIAKKHRLSVSFIQKQLDMGEKIEHEHTKNHELAREIALQHLDEIPDYYTRLKKMETDAKKHHKKFKDVSEGTLFHWFQGSSGKTKTGKRVKGWVQSDGSPCANEPGETGTPKCFSSGRLRSLKRKGKKGISLIKSAVRRKRQKDKGQQSKSGAAAPTNVPTFAKGKKDPNYVKAEPTIKETMELKEARKDRPGKGSGTKDACYHKVKARYDVWPSAYASGALVRCRRVGASNWGNTNESVDGSPLSYDWNSPIYENEQRYCPKCNKMQLSNECKYGPKYWSMFSLPVEPSNQEKFNIAQVHPANEEKDHEYSMARSELSTIISAAKRLRKKVKGEGGIEAWVQSKITKAADYIDTAADYLESGEHKVESVSIEDSNGKHYAEFIDIIKVEPLKPSRGIGSRLLGEGSKKCWKGYEKKGSQEIFGKRYNRCVKKEEYSDWRKELLEQGNYVMPSASQSGAYSGGIKGRAYKVGDTIPTSATKPKPQLNLKAIRDAGDKYGKSAFGEDWQSVNRKDKTDGMSQAAVDEYRRQNKDSKLQTAVTEKNPTGKDADRQNAFCRRMSGMKDKLTSKKTARDPDSRINKALRRWRCR
jgi:hypothetical protein